MTNTLTFTCSICGEPSTAICSYCTKDSCGNHLCERCGRCSDCCECEVHLDEPGETAPNGVHPVFADHPGPLDDQPVVAGVEPTAETPVTEEEQAETALPQEAVDAIIEENSEESPTISLIDTAAEEAPPDAPPADRHYE